MRKSILNYGIILFVYLSTIYITNKWIRISDNLILYKSKTIQYQNLLSTLYGKMNEQNLEFQNNIINEFTKLK